MRDKTPKKEFFRPLLQALTDLGGRAPIESVFQRVYELMGDSLTDVDKTELPSGGVRWKKTLNFAKMALAEDLLLESDGESWSITHRGREYLRHGHVSPIAKASQDDTIAYLRHNRDELLLLVKRWFESEHGRNSVETSTLETALRKVFRDWEP